MKFAQAIVEPGAWKLAHNDVWNVPGDTSEVRLDLVTRGPWSVIVKCTGLAVTLDGKVFGVRSLKDPKQSGYQLEGRVSIGGQYYSAFTCAQLFERNDGTLCQVAVLVVRYNDIEE